MNNSIAYQELEELVENDEEIRKHKLEIEKLKREQQQQLQRYMKKEIGTFSNLYHIITSLNRTRVCS